MHSKTLLSIGILIGLIITGRAVQAQQDPIASFTETSSDSIGVGGASTAVAQAFVLPTNAIVREVQLLLWRLTENTGVFQIEILDDNNGLPGGHLIGSAIFVEDVPFSQPGYVSFFIVPGQGYFLTAGTYWIKAESASFVGWRGKPYASYGTGGDTRFSTNIPPTWEKSRAMDLNFKVFGAPVFTDTTLTLTASDTTVSLEGQVTLTATVQAGGVNIEGDGTVVFEADDGAFSNNDVIYPTGISDGVKTVTWTAPATPGPVDIDATLTPYEYGGAAYHLASFDSIEIQVVQPDMDTTTEITGISSTDPTTYDEITITVTVEDEYENEVNTGTVVFTDTSSEGSFDPQAVDVVNGQAETTWNTPMTETGQFTITATYTHDGSGGTAYGSSSDPETVTVHYTLRDVQINLHVSPIEGYISTDSYDHPMWITVIVTDTTTGDQVQGNTVTLSHNTPDGWFSENPVSIPGGGGYTIFYTPTSPQAVVQILATYPSTDIDGYRYQSSQTPITFKVAEDPDGPKLRLFAEWVEDYPGPWFDLDNRRESVVGLRDVLQAAGFKTKVNGNADAKEIHWKSTQYTPPGTENSEVDARDISYYTGHGHPTDITFGYWKWLSTPAQKLDHSFLTPSEGKDAWGDGDLEWMIFESCEVLHSQEWKKCMEGVHLLVGSRTVMDAGIKKMGSDFANLIVQSGLSDPPVTIMQAWGIAYARHQGKKMHPKVYSESAAGLADFLWGHGPVETPDPPANSEFFSETELYQDVGGPVITGGTQINATVGVPVILDGDSLVTHPLSDYQEYLVFIWDLDPELNHLDENYDGEDNTATDDGDAFGPRPTVVFDQAESIEARLMVFDSHGQFDKEIVEIVVQDPPESAVIKELPPPPVENPWEMIMVVDNTGGIYPDEVQLPTFLGIGTEQVSLEQMESIGAFWSMGGDSQLDDNGTWSWVSGIDRLFVNQNSFGINYIDMTRAYRYLGPPAGLPTDQQAIDAVIAFMNANGTVMDLWAWEPVMTVNRISGDEDEPTFTTDTPYLKRVSAQRLLPVDQTTYPVVGPGGKVQVLVDEYGDVVFFLKIWREAVPYTPMPLIGGEQAVLNFEAEQVNALIGSVPPVCHTFEVESVSLAYYEEDWSTLQQTIYPVYVLHGKAIDDVGMIEMDLFMPAIDVPLIVHVTNPIEEFVTSNCNGTFTLEADAFGAAGPYTFNWYSDPDGFLGTGPAITVDLSLPEEGTSHLLHSIWVEVTAPNDFREKGFVQIEIVCVPPDFDRDTDVDQSDFGHFQGCITGPGLGPPITGCDDADFDADNDVDLSDFGLFQRCFSGATISADPGCVD